MPNSSANKIETLQRQLDLLEKGQDTLAAKNPHCFPIPWNLSPT